MTKLRDLLLHFVIGGTVTALIVGLEQSGRRSWSAFAALVPVFTVVSYVFIGASKDAVAVSQHSKFVLVGTLVSWIPYMLVVAFLAPRVGTNRAISIGLICFFVLACLYIGLVERFGWFR